MPTFAYEAMNQSGQDVKGDVDAQSSEDALSKIRNLGYFPSRIREKGGKSKAAGAAKKKGKKGFSFGGGVSTKALTQMTRQLSTLQDAGLPILRSLHILGDQQKPGSFKNILAAMTEDIEGGSTLSEACAKHPKAFNRLYVNMVAAGETGGVLDTILQRLAEFMEKAQKLKKKVQGAMVYPVVVIGFSLGIVSGIMIFVIPKFTQIFIDFDVELPSATLILMGISTWFVHGIPPGYIVLPASPFAAFMLYRLIRSSDGGRYVVDYVTLKIPVLGNLAEKNAVARFSRTLGTLITAGVPILEAVKITRDTSGNEVYARALNAVHDSIREGESVSEPLRKAKVVDGLVTNMIDVGEETGDLDKMLIRIADNYDEEIDVAVAGLVALIEPIMVIVLGSIVGFIVIALFMPLVSLIGSVGG